MIRICGVILLLIALFLISQSIPTVYYDYNKNQLDESSDKQIRDVYATVDKIGIVTAGKYGKWYNLPTKILIFLGVVVSSGLLLIWKPNEFPLKSKNQIHLKNFLIVFSVIFVTFLGFYVKYVNRGFPPGLEHPYLTLSGATFVILITALLFLIVNRQIPEISTQVYSIIWLVLASIIIANGFLIECYSLNNPTHQGDFAQFDYLGIAIYEGWSHNWTLAYTIFRITNNILIIFGILLISVIVSKSKKTAP